MTRPSEVNLLCNVPPDALTGLTRLDVNGWTDITDTGVQCLSMLSNLRQLDLNKCHRITRRLASIRVDSRPFGSIRVDSRPFGSIRVESRPFASFRIESLLFTDG